MDRMGYPTAAHRLPTACQPPVPPVPQVFEKFLAGSTLAECYDSVAAVANRWLDMLDTRVGGLGACVRVCVCRQADGQAGGVHGGLSSASGPPWLWLRSVVIVIPNLLA